MEQKWSRKPSEVVALNLHGKYCGVAIYHPRAFVNRTDNRHIYGPSRPHNCLPEKRTFCRDGVTSLRYSSPCASCHRSIAAAVYTRRTSIATADGRLQT